MHSSKVHQPHDPTNKQDHIDQDYTECYVWGSNHHGQLGIGNKYAGKTYISPLAWSFNHIVVQVSCGEEHSAFITLKGQLFTMGSNAEGRLGIGDPSLKYSAIPLLVDEPSRLKAAHVSCGSSHTVAVTDTGDAFTWGLGSHGALGTGSITDAWEPVRICLDQKAFIGVKKASAGSRHTAFISNLGTLYVCGTSDSGQLGTGRRDKELVPVHVNLISEKVKDVACGAFHTLILVERGRVYATGGNTLGQLGLGNKKNTNIPIRIKEFDHEKVTQIGAGHHSAALTDRGDLFIWGTGVFGEYLSPVKFSYPGVRFKSMSLGAFFGVAIDEEKNVWTWGSNANGELGTDSNDVKGKVTHNPFFDGKRVETVACGGSFAVGLGQTVRQNRKSMAGSPLKSRAQQFSQSPERRQQRRLHDSVMAVSFEHEESKATIEKIPSKGGVLPEKKAGHFRGNSIDNNNSRTRSRPSENEAAKNPLNGKREERRDGSAEGHQNKGEDPLVALLMKQKAVLEKCLRDEKQEKMMLEHSLLELKKRMIDLQEGPGGFGDLGEMMNRQARKFDELKTMYDEESNKKERLARDLACERQRSKELADTLNIKEEKIITLQKRIDTLESRIRERHRETEDITQNLLQHNGKLKQELENKIEEVLRLHQVVEDFKAEVGEKKEIINKLEDSLNKELLQKREMEFELRNLTLTLESANKNIQQTTAVLQQETGLRTHVEKDLEGTQQREEAGKERIQQLERELEQLHEEFEQTLLSEQENNAKLAQDLENANNAGAERESENENLRRKLKALEQDLIEHQDKNKKLINLLSNEIDKQAEQFRKKTYDALVGPASKLAANILKASKENGGGNPEDEYVSLQNLKTALTIEPSNKLVSNNNNVWPSAGFSNAVTSWGVNMDTKGFNNSHSHSHNNYINIVGVGSPSHGGLSSFNATESEPLDIEKLRKELYEGKSTVESRLEISPRIVDPLAKRQHLNVEKFNLVADGNLSQDELEGTFGGEKEDGGLRKPLKFMGGFMGRNKAMEEARARLCKSANKLRDILDLPEQENRNDKFGKSMNTTPTKEDKKREKTPIRSSIKEETTPAKEDRKGLSEKKSSAQKGSVLNTLNTLNTSPSPYKVPRFREQEQPSQGEMQEAAHVQNLREVKARLEMLQKNKQVLENKMQSYETKLKSVN